MLEPVQTEYERWLALAGESDPFQSSTTLGLRDVLHAHFLLIDYFSREGEAYGGMGPRDLNLLHSALGRQFVGFGGRRKWVSHVEVCATLFYGLIMDHPFHDCNKRTAFLALLYHLWVLGKCPAAKQREFETLAVRTADHALNRYPSFGRFGTMPDPEVSFIAYFLRRNTRDVDRRFYAITYNDLQTILGRFDCRLANPHGNRIDVEKVTVRRGIIGRRQIREYVRVAQIGFPGWTRQVGKGAIRTVRQKAGLTPENGFDSQVFFKGVSPLSALLDEFREPLRRLADR